MEEIDSILRLVWLSGTLPWQPAATLRQYYLMLVWFMRITNWCGHSKLNTQGFIPTIAGGCLCGVSPASPLVWCSPLLHLLPVPKHPLMRIYVHVYTQGHSPSPSLPPPSSMIPSLKPCNHNQWLNKSIMSLLGTAGQSYCVIMDI